MTKEKALYQVKIILDCLPKEEYELISKETIKYIEENMEYDENIFLIPKMPLEKQNIDEKALDILEKIIDEIEKNPKKNRELDMLNKESLMNIIEEYKKENSKIPKAKELIKKYETTIKEQEEEIEKLKNINSELYASINKCPFLVRKIFFRKFEKKLLK